MVPSVLVTLLMCVANCSERSVLIATADATIPACSPGDWVVCACSDGATGAAQCTSTRLFDRCVCPAPSCIIGESRPCHCVDGAAGAQRCEPPGAFGACECSARVIDAGSDVIEDETTRFDACGAAGEACVPRTCASYRLGCGFAPDGCGCTLDCGSCGSGVQPVDLRVNHVVADPTRRRYYATVAASDLVAPNTVAVIDPYASWNITFVPVGSDPNAIAISPDASTLWIGLDGVQGMRRVDIVGSTDPVLVPAADTIPLGGAAYALLVLAESPRAVVASIHEVATTGYVSTRVFDDGVARPTSIDGPFPCMRGLVGGSGGHAFANGCSSAGELWSLVIDSNGVTGSSRGMLLQDGASPWIAYGASYVFGYDGNVIDVSDSTNPVAQQRFTVGGAVFPDVANDRVWFIGADYSTSSGTIALRRAALSSRVVLESIPMPAVRTPVAELRDLVRASRREFAVVGGSSGFYAGPGPLYLLHGVTP